ncbi:hypothetical protein BDY21DRAFT_340517 [Lineolata rhizophorae]|uniref:BRCT domain-containing protein n=1 Tax=Lineolata rhizophorae TaxID=578093 RepID=A0A6A6P426_9PEZI|nr:hypothetical protein BDY21DRAFT_340517 [Lineolata rhizophorae]
MPLIYVVNKLYTHPNEPFNTKRNVSAHATRAQANGAAAALFGKSPPRDELGSFTVNVEVLTLSGGHIVLDETDTELRQTTTPRQVVKSEHGRSVCDTAKYSVNASRHPIVKKDISHDTTTIKSEFGGTNMPSGAMKIEGPDLIDFGTSEPAPASWKSENIDWTEDVIAKTAHAGLKVEDNYDSTHHPVAKPAVKGLKIERNDYIDLANESDNHSNPNQVSNASESPYVDEASKVTQVSNSLKRRRILVTGVIKDLTRRDVHAFIERHGGIPALRPKDDVDYVIIGDKPGSKKMEKIEDLGLRMMSWDTLVSKCPERPKKLTTGATKRAGGSGGGMIPLKKARN